MAYLLYNLTKQFYYIRVLHVVGLQTISRLLRRKKTLIHIAFKQKLS